LPKHVGEAKSQFPIDPHRFEDGSETSISPASSHEYCITDSGGYGAVLGVNTTPGLAGGSIEQAK